MDEERTDLLAEEVIVINIGLPEFFDALQAQGVKAVHVDWRPPAADDEELIDLLDQLL